MENEVIQISMIDDSHEVHMGMQVGNVYEIDGLLFKSVPQEIPYNCRGCDFTDTGERHGSNMKAQFCKNTSMCCGKSGEDFILQIYNPNTLAWKKRRV
ncbi:hypothetical protein KAR91_38750 [Candidatus Pacearchaeota archaeon]|nr:hypothetical protein [Candidatus Pacearchaeota archaeon]